CAGSSYALLLSETPMQSATPIRPAPSFKQSLTIGSAERFSASRSTHEAAMTDDIAAETFGPLHLYKRDVKAAIADEAKAIVTGARRSAYGTPEDNFARIARFWQAYFENTGRGDVQITARDISPLMRLMKEARLCESPDHRDSFVDLVGYTLTGAEINGVEP